MVGPRLVGRVEVPRLGRRPERSHHHPRGIRTQIERLPVQEVDLLTRRSLVRLGFDNEVQAPCARIGGDARRRSVTRANCRISARPEDTTPRFTAAVLVGAVAMQPVATASGLDVDQRQRQIVAAGNQAKARAASVRHSVAVGPPRCEARGDCRRGFERLLIEGRGGVRCFPKLSEPTGRKKPAGAVCSVISQRRVQPGFDLAVRRRHPGNDQGLGQPRIVVGKARPRTIPSPASRRDQDATSACLDKTGATALRLVGSGHVAIASIPAAQRPRRVATKSPRQLGTISRKGSGPAPTRRTRSERAHSPSAQSVRPWLSSEPLSSSQRRSKLMKFRKRFASGFQACWTKARNGSSAIA